LDLPEKNRRTGSRTPSISDSPHNLSHFLAGWPIFRLKLAEVIESFGENWYSWEIGLEGFLITWNPVNGRNQSKSIR
jgi:hypothetical protein